MTVTPSPESVTGAAVSVTPAPVAAPVIAAVPLGAAAAPLDDDREAMLRRVARAQGITVPELVERLRDVASTHHRDASLCPWCEGPMPAELTPWQRYCSRNCSKEASRHRLTRRREAEATGATQGTCDACGRGCHLENALCDACMDDLTDQARATSQASHTDTAEENSRG